MDFRSTPQYPTYESWVQSPLYQRLWILFEWKLVVQQARVYLIGSNLVSGPRDLPGYYDFAKRVMFHIKNVGAAAAAPLIQADAKLFKSWNFSGQVLASLARLQGIVVSS
jgi:hypothetical protein